MNWTAATINFDSVQQNAVAVAGDGGIEFDYLAGGRELQGAAFDADVAASQGVASDRAGVVDKAAAAGEAEVVPKMHFLRRFGRKDLHPFGDFHKTFLAPALFAAGGGDVDAEGFGTVKKRRTGRNTGVLLIEVQLDVHATAGVIGSGEEIVLQSAP
jgi:hypothetical protein